MDEVILVDWYTRVDTKIYIYSCDFYDVLTSTGDAAPVLSRTWIDKGSTNK